MFHNVRIGVGAQSTLGGGDQIFARKICIKNQQNARILHDSCPKNYQNRPTQNFYDICPKNLQNSRILHDSCPKNARILHNKCPKNIFPKFRGPRAPPPAPVSYAYVQICVQ